MPIIKVQEETAGKIAAMLLQIQAIKLSTEKPFSWSSGWKSPIYCDNRLSLSYPEIRTTIKLALVQAIRENFFTAQSIAGVATAGIAQGALVADILNLPFLYVRPKPKDHGMENLIEGKIVKGQKVVVVEDLVSTGGSSLKATQALKQAGFEVLGMVSIFNYGFDIATRNFYDANTSLITLCDYPSLLKYALDQQYISEDEVISLKAWRVDPANWKNKHRVPNLNTFSPISPQKLDGDRMQENFAKGSHIVVIGAGVFGSWSALYLLRKGFRVTLVDAWGPAHARSSSSDETRVIRSTYGANETYFDLNVEAIALWKENQERFGKQLFFNTGVLWFCYEQHTPLVDDSIPFARRHKMEYEYLTPSEIKKRFSQININDLHHAYFDPYGGYLKAKESVKLVNQAFLNEGGSYIQSQVQPGRVISNRLDKISLSDGSSLQADAYLFACGSWLGKLFPGILENVITCTKQEVYYFGVPSAHAEKFQDIPVWVDVDGKNFYYGIAGNQHRGFKIGVDVRGEIFDPTSGDRTYSPETLQKASAFIGHRFPHLKNAPLIASSVCPYENSPDGNFIFDRLPETSNTFILGGGSGHGFKHAPALGHLVAQVFAGEKKSPALFSLTAK